MIEAIEEAIDLGRLPDLDAGHINRIASICADEAQAYYEED